MATALSECNPELDAEIAEEEHRILHLVRSNKELEEHLKEVGHDPELREAVGENIVVIARKRAALQLLYDRRNKAQATEPISGADVQHPHPPPAPVNDAAVPGAPNSEASVEAAAQMDTTAPATEGSPEGSVYL